MASSGITSCRDRTNEFHSTIRTFQSRMNNTTPVNPIKNNAKQNLDNRSKFMLIARLILLDYNSFFLK